MENGPLDGAREAVACEGAVRRRAHLAGVHAHAVTPAPEGLSGVVGERRVAERAEVSSSASQELPGARLAKQAYSADCEAALVGRERGQLYRAVRIFVRGGHGRFGDGSVVVLLPVLRRKPGRHRG